ncbi:peroxiredoxin [Bradyrhizobium sp. LTSPM299]|uniref:Ohr family peroxiredoxin n=1 Tax=Bradyrhizobium sp. LTSPM299 TaxID=1619233 RepID=UPI0005DAD0EF|nr:Ohr family peroxiredoxin [Bradyrhizobium sp. LTSPM299]KJC60317.1 peroxiredoxin [Bradyrhizobium sp. LTSPM299]
MSAIQRPPIGLLERYTGADFLPLYTARVTLIGGEARHGRASGIAKSDDGALSVDLRLPNELGGPGGGTNPEQLFAAGFAACFHGALNLIASKGKLPIRDSSIRVSVTFGRDPADGLFLLKVDTEVTLPGLDRTIAQELIKETERVCPYSKVLRQGCESTIWLT